MRLCWLLLAALALPAEEVSVRGLQQPVEILRDRWGVPHIYARTQDDLFFAQGYMAARDRLFQLDLWRRQGTGKLAEVLGPDFVERDRTALLLRFRGDWQKEWPSYAPDTWQIVNAFVRGINAYIQDPQRKKTADFRKLGFEPGLWQPNDVVSRMAAFTMMTNLLAEAQRARLVDTYGAEAIEKWLPPDPFVKIEIPRELNLKEVRVSALTAFDEATDELDDATQGSNNWVVSGRLSATGKPLLASDPHRGLQIPSLRRTVHLVGPGWNVFGSGEPALPGIALGHNETIGFGFTITGTDQQDLYIEQLHPTDPTQYLHKGAWKRLETERHAIVVKGESKPRVVETQYTVHGPVVGTDLAMRRAYVMRWVGAEPGTAGYLAGLSLARAKDWPTFLQAVARFKAPAENLVYADTAGHIGFAVAGLTPVRGNWTGLLPVPGHTGDYEWKGFLAPEALPRALDPATGFFASANNNILPPGYKHTLQYEWAPRFRVNRIEQQLRTRRGWTVDAMATLQHDIDSLPARRLLAATRKWTPPAGSKASTILPLLRAWDGRMTKDSAAPAVYLMWISRLAAAVSGQPGLAASIERTLQTIESNAQPELLTRTLDATVAEFEKALGPDPRRWQYGNIHFLQLRHPAMEKSFDRGPIPLGGDATTVNVAAGPGFRATTGASFRMLLDLADWDRSRMTNLPGESGDPDSPHYADLIDDWANGRYHPMPFTRAAVESFSKERILLKP